MNSETDGRSETKKTKKTENSIKFKKNSTQAIFFDKTFGLVYDAKLAWHVHFSHAQLQWVSTFIKSFIIDILSDGGLLLIV